MVVALRTIDSPTQKEELAEDYPMCKPTQQRCPVMNGSSERCSRAVHEGFFHVIHTAAGQYVIQTWIGQQNQRGHGDS